jgi:dTDP-4-dehydrorhamnose reductase
VINAAGFVRVADAEHEIDACMNVNAEAPVQLARACEQAGIPFVTYSSDLVFDGAAGPYVESDVANPRTVYGRSKAQAEAELAGGKSLIIRTSAFFGPWDRYNFAWAVLEALREGREFSAAADAIVSPTYVPDLCHATLDHLIDGEAGVWHVANAGAVSWYEFARLIAEGAGYDTELIRPSQGQAGDTTLMSERGAMLRPLELAIDDYLHHVAREEGELLPSDVAAE